MRKNIKLMFERSDQAVLLLDKSVICYANPQARIMLGMDPTGTAIVDLADFNFVKECFERHTDKVTFHKNVRFQNQCFHVSRTAFKAFTLLFLHFRKEAQFTETFLRDTLLSLVSQIKGLPEGRQKREMETFVTATLAVATPTCTLTDLHEFLAYTLSHFDCLAEKDQLTVELEDTDATVFLYAELMHLTLIWMILDLVRMLGADGSLAVSYKREENYATLSFRAENAVCPSELYDLLFAETAEDVADVLCRNGSALFRAKRVFALHDSVLEYAERKNGFVLSARFAIADAPPTLYAPLTGLVSTWSLSPEELQGFIRGYLEEA